MKKLLKRSPKNKYCRIGVCVAKFFFHYLVASNYILLITCWGVAPKNKYCRIWPGIVFPVFLHHLPVCSPFLVIIFTKKAKKRYTEKK